MNQPASGADRDMGLVRLVPADRPGPGAIDQDAYDLDCPWHHHDMHQLQYAFEGSMEIEDAAGRHLLPRSLAAWIPAGTRHRDSLHRIRSVSVLLPARWVTQAGAGVRIVAVTPLMREMMAEARRWPLDRPLDRTARTSFACFARLCDGWIATSAPFTLPTARTPALAAALQTVQIDPAGCTLQDALTTAGMSERTLRRRCHSELGMGWDAYRRRARLLVAVDALARSDRAIGQITADVGFESQSAFTRAFRDLVGMTPAAFRRDRD